MFAGTDLALSAALNMESCQVLLASDAWLDS